MSRVLVMGGGLAGLSAACYLARAGFKPALVEQAKVLGGYAGSFRAQGYSFERGLRAIEDGGTLLAMLRQLGLEGQLDLLPNPVSLSIGGRVFPMRDGADIAAYFAALPDFFPGEGRAIAAIAKDALRICKRMDGLYGRDNPLFIDSLAGKRAALPWLVKNLGLFLEIRRGNSSVGMRLTDYLASRTANASLARLLSEPFFEGTPMFFGLGYSRLFQDYRYPRGGMQALPDLLVRYIEERGGMVFPGERIERLEVVNGSVRRALSATGAVFEAEQFIYAGDMKRLYLNLLDGESVPASLRERVANGRPAESVVSAYLGIDLPPERFVEAGAHFIHLPSHDFSRSGISRGERDYFKAVSVEVSIPCLRDPTLAPPGKTGMILSAAARPKDLEGEEGYEAAKARIAADLVASVETLHPGISGHVEFALVSSPGTMERYTLNSGGAVNGWSSDRELSPVPIDFLRLGAAVMTPLPNLWQAGHWTFSPAGAPVAIMTGKLASDRAAARLR